MRIKLDELGRIGGTIARSPTPTPRWRRGRIGAVDVADIYADLVPKADRRL